MAVKDLREEVIREWRERGYTRHQILRHWRLRDGPFRGDEKDTPGEVQIMPFPAPPLDEQVGP